MKQIKMHIVKTQHNSGSENFNTTFVHMNNTRWINGWGLPMHAQKIISEKTDMVDVFEVGDRVICELKRGTYEDEDGISSGGRWIKKTGTVESTHGHDDTDGFVRFDDGDIQNISLIRGDNGYPGRNIQPATIEIILPNEVLKNRSYIDDPIDESPFHECPEPYRRGIGQGFGPGEDGDL